MPENMPDFMPDFMPENNIGHPGGFEGDLLNAPRDVAGVSTVAAHPFPVNRDAVAARFDRHPSILTRDAVTWPDEQPGAYRGRFHRHELIRLAHLDLSLTGDAGGRRPGPEFVPPRAGRQGSRTVVGGPMLLARPDRRRLAGELVGGRTMPARGPVAGHRCGSTPPWPYPTPTPRRRPVSPVGGPEGRRSRRGDDMVHVPRREIARGVAAAFENGRLKIARAPPPAGAPVGELRTLQVRFTAGGRDTYTRFMRARRPGDGGGDGVWFERVGCWRGPRKELPGHQGLAPI